MLFLTKINDYQKKSMTNKNVTKMGLKALHSWSLDQVRGTLCTNDHFAEHNAQCPPHKFIICAKASTCTENITGEEGQLPSHWSDKFMKSISALNLNPKPTFDSEFWDSCLMTKFKNSLKTLKWVCFLRFSEKASATTSFDLHLLMFS